MSAHVGGGTEKLKRSIPRLASNPMLHHLTAAFCLLISCSSFAAADDSFTAKAYEAGCRVIAENARPSDVVLAVKAGQCLGAVRTIELLNDSLERPRRYCAPREISL